MGIIIFQDELSAPSQNPNLHSNFQATQSPDNSVRNLLPSGFGHHAVRHAGKAFRLLAIVLGYSMHVLFRQNKQALRIWSTSQTNHIKHNYYLPRIIHIIYIHSLDKAIVIG
jgi:hypothetical protein